MSNKICILGFGRAGKDEAAGFFNDHLGLPYAGSTSWNALPLMAAFMGLHPQLAWERRHQHRQFWKDSLDEFRRENPLLLVQRAFDTYPGARVITGLRDRREVQAAKEKNFFEHYLWVERAGIPPDDTVTFDASDCDSFVKNDGTLRRFHRNLCVWALSINLDVKPSSHAMDLLNDLDPE